MKLLRELARDQLYNKRVILRVAYDVPLKDGKVLDARRIKETVSTIEYLLQQQAKVIIMSWLGRPNGRDELLSLRPVAKVLSELIERPIKMLEDCCGGEVERAVYDMHAGEIVMLQNTRFYKEEEAGDDEFARKLASLGDIVVFDAFAQAHRIHASTTGLVSKLATVAGFLMQKEIETLSKLKTNSKHPFVILMSGAKISDKVQAIEALSQKADIILLGGALAHPFYVAQGYEIGGSLLETSSKGEHEYDPVTIASRLLDAVSVETGHSPIMTVPDPDSDDQIVLSRLQLPFDVVIAKKDDTTFQDEDIVIKRLAGHTKELAKNTEAIVDIGPYTIAIYKQIIKQAKTIFWNGPVGVFEDFDFSQGTREIAEAIAESDAYTVIGGGDTEEVINAYHLEGKFDFVSTGGGATLEYLGTNDLPVLKYM